MRILFFFSCSRASIKYIHVQPNKGIVTYFLKTITQGNILFIKEENVTTTNYSTPSVSKYKMF
jgi:hypothetical protein